MKHKSPKKIWCVTFVNFNWFQLLTNNHFMKNSAVVSATFITLLPLKKARSSIGAPVVVRAKRPLVYITPLHLPSTKYGQKRPKSNPPPMVCHPPWKVPRFWCCTVQQGKGSYLSAWTVRWRDGSCMILAIQQRNISLQSFRQCSKDAPSWCQFWAWNSHGQTKNFMVSKFSCLQLSERNKTQTFWGPKKNKGGCQLWGCMVCCQQAVQWLEGRGPLLAAWCRKSGAVLWHNNNLNEN